MSYFNENFTFEDGLELLREHNKTGKPIIAMTGGAILERPLMLDFLDECEKLLMFKEQTKNVYLVERKVDYGSYCYAIHADNIQDAAVIYCETTSMELAQVKIPLRKTEWVYTKAIDTSCDDDEDITVYHHVEYIKYTDGSCDVWQSRIRRFKEKEIQYIGGYEE